MNMTNYRLLIQLVDAADEAEARLWIRLMHGERCEKVAVFERGSQRLTNKSDSCSLLPKTSNGYTVFVPKEFRL